VQYLPPAEKLKGGVIMRMLTKKQKEIIKNWVKGYVAQGNPIGILTEALDVMPLGVYERIEALGDTEVLHQAVTAYMQEVYENLQRVK